MGVHFDAVPTTPAQQPETGVQKAIRIAQTPLAHWIPGAEDAIQRGLKLVSPDPNQQTFDPMGLNSAAHAVLRLAGVKDPEQQNQLVAKGATALTSPSALAQAATAGGGLGAHIVNAGLGAVGAHEAYTGYDPTKSLWENAKNPQVLGGAGNALLGMLGLRGLTQDLRGTSTAGKAASEATQASKAVLENQLSKLRTEVQGLAHSDPNHIQEILDSNPAYAELSQDTIKKPGGPNSLAIFGANGRPKPLSLAERMVQNAKDAANDLQINESGIADNAKLQKSKVDELNAGFKANADANAGLAKAQAVNQKVVGGAQDAAAAEDLKRTEAAQKAQETLGAQMNADVTAENKFNRGVSNAQDAATTENVQRDKLADLLASRTDIQEPAAVNEPLKAAGKSATLKHVAPAPAAPAAEPPATPPAAPTIASAGPAGAPPTANPETLVQGPAAAPGAIPAIAPGAPAAAPTPGAVPAGEDGNDWIQNALQNIQRLMDERGGVTGNQKGEITTEMMARLGFGTAGAATGAYEDPSNRLQGALIGGGLGFVAPDVGTRAFPILANAYENLYPTIQKGADFANRLHNSALLSLPSVAKKSMADVQGLIQAGIENPGKAGDILRQFTTPEGRQLIAQNFRQGMNQPSAEAAENLSGLENFYQKGPLSWAGRTMGGLTNATKGVLGEAGLTPEEQAYYTLTANPSTKLGKATYAALRSNRLTQHLSPFARIGINRLERAVDYSPFSLLSKPGSAGDNELKVIKSMMGPAAGAAAYELTPDDFVKQHPILSGVAAAGPMGIPMLAGMAMKRSAATRGGPSEGWAKNMNVAAKAIGQDVPGLRLLDDLTGEGFPMGFGRSYLSGYTTAARPFDLAYRQATGNTSVPITSGPRLTPVQSLTNKAISQVPGLSEQLPARGASGPVDAADPGNWFQ